MPLLVGLVCRYSFIVGIVPSQRGMSEVGLSARRQVPPVTLMHMLAEVVCAPRMLYRTRQCPRTPSQHSHRPRELPLPRPSGRCYYPSCPCSRERSHPAEADSMRWNHDSSSKAPAGTRNHSFPAADSSPPVPGSGRQNRVMLDCRDWRMRWRDRGRTRGWGPRSSLPEKAGKGRAVVWWERP